MSGFFAMLSYFIFKRHRDSAQLISPQISFPAMQAMTWLVDNVATSLQELLLFTSKDTPPYNLWRFSLFIRSKAMISSFKEIKREHPILLLNILYDFLPMRMIIQLRTQHLEGEWKLSFDEFRRYTIWLLSLNSIIKTDFRTSYLIAEIQKASQHTMTETEPIVFILQDGTKMCIYYLSGILFLKLHPYRIVCIIKEYGRSRRIF